MILDNENLFSKQQAITGTANSTNVIDLGAANQNIGVGYPLGLLAQVVEDFDNLTDLTIQVQTSTDEAFSSPITLMEVTVALADLVAGYRTPFLHVPRGVKRYMRLRYVVDGTNPSEGKVMAGLLFDQQDWRAYAGQS